MAPHRHSVLWSWILAGSYMYSFRCRVNLCACIYRQYFVKRNKQCNTICINPVRIGNLKFKLSRSQAVDLNTKMYAVIHWCSSIILFLSSFFSSKCVKIGLRNSFWKNKFLFRSVLSQSQIYHILKKYFKMRYDCSTFNAIWIFFSNCVIFQSGLLQCTVTLFVQFWISIPRRSMVYNTIRYIGLSTYFLKLSQSEGITYWLKLSIVCVCVCV